MQDFVPLPLVSQIQICYNSSVYKFLSILSFFVSRFLNVNFIVVCIKTHFSLKLNRLAHFVTVRNDDVIIQTRRKRFHGKTTNFPMLG